MEENTMMLGMLMMLEMFTFEHGYIPNKIFKFIHDNNLEVDEVKLIDHIMVLYVWCNIEQKSKLISLK